MEPTYMSFRGVDFVASPYETGIKMSKSITNTKIPFSKEKTEELCENSRVITGRGRFVGENASAKANELCAVFKTKGSAFLFTPAFSPIKVFFTELCLNIDTDNSCVNYSFTFVEDPNSQKRYEDFNYTRVRKNENIYDVANRCNLSVDELVRLNRVRNIFSLEEGEKLWLK
ncbi:MAG: DNA circularization N-terminal domain-containing protein [Eubacterium sp.]|nr:DNA circularization N-terminal domain-containing protein [Eubacterium sp.]